MENISDSISSVYRLIDFLASTDCMQQKIIINGNNVTIVLSPVLFLWQQCKVQCKIKNAKNMNTSDDTITRYFNIQIVGEHEQVRKLTSTHLFTNRHAHHNQHHQKQQPCTACNAGQ